MVNKIKLVDLNTQYNFLKKDIDRSIFNTIKRSDFINGVSVREFEYLFKKANHSNYFLTTNNGTDSLFIALKSLNLKAGDEVITTAHSWISTSSSVTLAGGRVVFCDTEENTFNIDASQIEKKITKKTKGLIIVHLYGQPCDMKEILTISKKYNLWIVEDCAQSHFAKYKDEHVGNFGSFGSFSFFPSKNLGAYGDGGGLVTNNKKLFNKALLLAKHGGFKKNQHLIEGMNSRMDGIQAAILNIKLKKINFFNKKRFKIANVYSNLLKNIGDISVPIIKKDRDHVFHLYVIKTKKRDKLKFYLKSKGIDTALHYPVALPFLRAYKYLGYSKKDFPVAYSNQKKILSLPIYPEMKIDQIEYVCKNIAGFFKKLA